MLVIAVAFRRTAMIFFPSEGGVEPGMRGMEQAANRDLSVGLGSDFA